MWVLMESSYQGLQLWRRLCAHHGRSPREIAHPETDIQSCVARGWLAQIAKS